MTPDEIKAARAWLDSRWGDGSLPAHTRLNLNAALDALECEPELRAEIEACNVTLNARHALAQKYVARIAALEAREARVREAVEHMPLADSRDLRAALDGE
jgi:hypothetical protein